MAFSPLNLKIRYPVRSNSFPSKPHPIISQVDHHLCILRGSEATSSSSVSKKLSGLKDLHDCVDKLLQLPLTQQSLSQESNERWVDELLEESIRLLDLCDMAKDAFLKTKQCTHELQSVLRRRRGAEMEITKEIQNCFFSRRLIKKTIHKALKGIEKKCKEKKYETPAVVSVLREVEEVSFSCVESLLSLIGGTKCASKFSRRSLVSKLVQHEKTSNGNEIERVDAALELMANYKTNKSDYVVQVENLNTSLAKFESNIQDLEEGVEDLFRRLIKIRVLLLNILNH